ncbi:PKD domain-containing protein [Geofilum sp. OHC36d9]|uniref:PKD domain-containing protein n=1 Tax=Geofilum sp. OHC36d9 TaxID=3458413 RepID=UPI0040348AE0
MKQFIKHVLFVTLSAILLVACAPQELDDYSFDGAPTEDDVTFTATVSAENANIIEFVNTSAITGLANWDFGNNTKENGDEVVSEYPFSGTYDVTLALYTPKGVASKTMSVVIENDDLSLLSNPLYTVLTGGAEAVDGKTWVFDQYHSGHFGVGPVGTTPSWWAAGPNDKLECSLYSNEFTFKQVGVELIWNNNGSVYTNNAGRLGLADLGYSNSTVPLAGDFDVEYAPGDNYHFTLVTSDSTLILSNGAFLGHYAGTSTYHIVSISDTAMYVTCASTVEDGNGWWYRFVPKELNVKPVTPTKAKPLFEDFESEKPEIDFEKEAMGELTDSAYQNPAPVPLNESSTVYLYQKKAGEFYSNISYTVSDYKFDLTTQNKITLKVFIPSYNDYTTENETAGDLMNNVLQASVAVKLQNSELGNNAWSTQTEVLLTDLEKDKWLELTFDFTDVNDRTDYDKIVIQFGTEGHTGGGIFFFDDFSFHE